MRTRSFISDEIMVAWSDRDQSAPADTTAYSLPASTTWRCQLRVRSWLHGSRVT